MTSGNAAKAIAMAGLACGVLDITAALVVYGSMGLKPLRLFAGKSRPCAGAKIVPGRSGHRGARLGVAFCDRVWRRGRLLRCEPRHAGFGGASHVVWPALRHRRLLLHEPHRCAPLGSDEVSLFP